MLVRLNGATTNWNVTTTFGESGGIVGNYPHTGIDVTMQNGTQIQSLTDGVVKAVTHDAVGSGNSVYVHLGNGDDVLYSHLDKLQCTVGDVLHQGSQLGTLKNSMLHVGVFHNGMSVDPLTYFHAVVNHAVAQVFEQTQQLTTALLQLM